MAKADRGKIALQDMAEKWGQTLMIQHAWELVVFEPRSRSALTTEIETQLNRLGFLNGLSLYDDVNQQYVSEMMEKTAFRIDNQRQRSNNLEGILFGSHFGLIGEAIAAKPGKKTDDKGRIFTRVAAQGDGATPEYVAPIDQAKALWKARSVMAGPSTLNAPGKIEGVVPGVGANASSIFQGGKSNVLAYLAKLYNDPAFDAGIPGREELVLMYEVWYTYFSEGAAFAGIIAGMRGSGTARMVAFNEADSAEGTTAIQAPGGIPFAAPFVGLMWLWYQYVIAAGYYDEAEVEDEADRLFDMVVQAWASEIVEKATEDQNPVEAALTPPVPAPAPPPINNLTPFDFQCFLIENIVTLSSLHRGATYKNLFRLQTNNNPGTALSRIHHGSRSAQIKELLNMCPEAYALLTPYIKLFRVDYDKKKPTQIIKEQELKIPNFVDPSDIDSMLGSGGGRFKGYGIKSFKWSLDGVQPAEVDNNISANLTFYFQTIQDLFQGQRAAGQPEPSPLDLIISSTAAEAVSQNNTDDSISSAPKDCGVLRDNINQQYDGAHFRIKAVVGWSTPPNFAYAFPRFADLVDAGGGRKRPRGELLLEALESTRVTLFLQQTRHLINFQEDGSIELEIDYQAALSGILTSKKADILATDKKFFEQEIETYEKQLKTLEETSRQQPNDTAVQEKMEAILLEIEQLRVQNRMFKYKKFLQKLYDMGMVYNVNVNAAELLIPPWKDLTASERAARAHRRLSPNEAERGWLASGVNNNQATFDTSLLTTVTELSRDPRDVEGALAEQAQDNQKRFQKFEIDADTVMIPYFYLGDLLDVIIDGLPGYQKGEAFFFFLSEMELLNPLLAFQMSNLAEVLCSPNLEEASFIDALRRSDPLRFGNINRIQEVINIGDVPISLDAFSVWFKDNVVEKGRDNYYFLHFVKDICAQLITNALRGDCFGNDVNFDMRFDTAPFEVEKTGLTAGTSVSVSKLARKKAAVTGTSSPKKIRSAILLYSTDSKPKARLGNFAKDLDAGIYHHYVGSSCGIVKGLQFQREDQPMLREIKIQKKGALGAEQLRELYSVSLDLVGNTLYRNGQYIYVDPTYVMGNAALARLLGISGYYMVTAVEHSISDAGYDVNVRALQEGVSFGDNTVATQPRLLATDLEETPTYVAPDLREQRYGEYLSSENSALGDAIRAQGGFIGAITDIAGTIDTRRDIIDLRTGDQRALESALEGADPNSEDE